MKKYKDIFGIIEHVSLPEVGLFDVPAKVDTGAYSGALHCESIEECLLPDGKTMLRFILPGGRTVELKKFVRTFVRSSSGHRLRRYLFDTKVIIKGEEYSIRIGLSDRKDMNYEILLGRRFLHDNHILVDVKLNQDLDIDRKKKNENSHIIQRSC
ncbi:hypothetical protein HGB24_02955 [Candidatus Saccharibacteria bacterium]|nr:hypothetical protein [Candidatus Saccharibacteria bacterium]